MAGSLFLCSATQTLKYDLKTIVLHLHTFSFMLLPLITVTLFLTKSISGLILKTSIISPLIVCLWRENINCFNRSLYNKLRDVGMCFVAHLYIFSIKFWSVTRIELCILSVASQMLF